MRPAWNGGVLCCHKTIFLQHFICNQQENCVFLLLVVLVAACAIPIKFYGANTGNVAVGWRTRRHCLCRAFQRQEKRKLSKSASFTGTFWAGYWPHNCSSSIIVFLCAAVCLFFTQFSPLIWQHCTTCTYDQAAHMYIIILSFVPRTQTSRAVYYVTIVMYCHVPRFAWLLPAPGKIIIFRRMFVLLWKVRACFCVFCRIFCI